MILFVDLKSAFYRVVRELVLPHSHGADWSDIVDALAIPPALEEGLSVLLRHPSLLEQQLPDPHLRHPSRKPSPTRGLR